MSPSSPAQPEGAGPAFTCVVCGWQGPRWARVETRPGRFRRLACPSCRCHLRDRLVWQLIAVHFERPSLRILEIGGTERLARPLRARHDYVNADIVARSVTPTVLLIDGSLPLPSRSRDLVILSHVLGAIVDRSARVRLLAELRRVSVERGRLLLFDDLDFSNRESSVLPDGTFFHSVRFGRDLFTELLEAGWTYQLVTRCAVSAALAARRELPYIVAVARAGPSAPEQAVPPDISIERSAR